MFIGCIWQVNHPMQTYLLSLHTCSLSFFFFFPLIPGNRSTTLAVYQSRNLRIILRLFHFTPYRHPILYLYTPLSFPVPVCTTALVQTLFNLPDCSLSWFSIFSYPWFSVTIMDLLLLETLMIIWVYSVILTYFYLLWLHYWAL